MIDPNAPAGLYIHVPFCLRKCAYCDFCSYAGLGHLHADYVRALCLEVGARASTLCGREPVWRDVRFDTVFVGGGTPTVLAPSEIACVLDVCRQHLDISEDAEITVEANPGTVDETSLRALRAAGVNRLSLGVQSLRDDELALLGRIHSAAQARGALDAARRVGFENINLDLIYGLPGQPLKSWRETLTQVVTLGPEHLSLYGLSVEEHTPLAARIAAGKLPPPDDEIAADMYELAEQMLEASGYVHYEISNWARKETSLVDKFPPRLACRHNLKYWHNERYLGIGASACSYDGERRVTNVWDPAEYIERIERGGITISEWDETDADTRMDETMMLGLRLVEGVSNRRFEARFGALLDAVYGSRIEALVRDGLLVQDVCGIRLTARGRLLGNRVFAEFLR